MGSFQGLQNSFKITAKLKVGEVKTFITITNSVILYEYNSNLSFMESVQPLV